MTNPTVFISYSHKDEIWKDRLKPHLGMLEKDGRLTIWDDRSIDGGETWFPEIKEAMERAAVAVCLISADYLNSNFCVKEEIPYFLDKRKNEGMLLLPVLIRACLWEEIDWLKSIQMLPRDCKAVAKDFKDDWDTPFAEVAKRVISFLKEPKPEVIELKSLLKRIQPVQVDVDRLPVTGAELFGRQKELKILDEAWASGKLNVISLVAWGGVGKSTLVNKWREQMAVDNYRDAQRVFAWSFYSQGTGDTVSSADLFIAEALKWFGDPDPTQGSPWDKGQRLAELVRREKTLLLLDGMEPLQSYLDLERGKIKDPALETLVTELARENPGLCVITTRVKVASLDDFPQTTHQIDLEQISAEAGRALLRVGGVQGTDAELEQAARDFGLHALALNLLAAYLRDVPGHPISHAAEIPDLDIPLERGRHPRRVMNAFAKRLGDSPEVEALRMLGLFNSPAGREEITALRASPPIPGLTEGIEKMTDTEWLGVITRLRRMKLLAPESSHRPDALDCHPLLREHFGEQLKETNPAAWREANNRLYEYYKTSAKELPDTLQEMAPLFAAVMHGCQAGRYQEAFWEVFYQRIRREKEAFTLKKLGSFGSDLAALSGFFDSGSWRKPVDGLREDYKSFVLGEAGFDLRALGRLAEAAQPMQASLDSAIAQKDWKQAAIRASNLSELTLTLGDVKQALDYAEQSVALADQSGDEFDRMDHRTLLAYALSQSGKNLEAETIFREAEEMQKKLQPQLPLLYSSPGFRYCDLLLSQGHAAEVEQRAQKALEIVLQGSRNLLDIALNNLSLGRARMAVGAIRESPLPNDALSCLNRAVEGLRQAGTVYMLPLGLLARAEYYRTIGDFDRAQRDLDEAFSISTRGGMGLHLADCHLGYARLFMSLRGDALSPKQPPNDKITPNPGEVASGSALATTYHEKAREHLSTAKEMIEEMGYHRRDKEVEELERELNA
jgi:tetratricopeptide (TPR) repeat protein